MFAGVNAVMVKFLEDLKQKYYLGHEGETTLDMHWDYLKKNLDALLSATSSLDAEVELKATGKDSEESLLQFICRF